MSRVHSTTLWRGGLAAILLLLASWVFSNLEWTSETFEVPAKGEAARQPYYVLRKLIGELGGTSVHPQAFTQMPPIGATLWLDLWSWNRTPAQARQLKAWVEQGGHLVVAASMLRADSTKPDDGSADPQDDPQDDPANAGQDAVDEAVNEAVDETLDAASNDASKLPWIPITAAYYSTNGPETNKRGDIDLSKTRCLRLRESGEAPYFADSPRERDWRWCISVAAQRLVPSVEPVWALGVEDHLRVVRVGMGRGTVTAHTLPNLLEGKALTQGDHAVIAAALLQLRRGSEVWIVEEDHRAPLLQWIWDEGRMAVVLGGLALALALWRNTLRFGPRAAPDVPGRRSMAEQIAGTARFLMRHEPAALHAAAVEALEQLAARRYPPYREAIRSERAAWLGRISGLPAADLVSALDARRERHRAQWLADIRQLETARRRLAACGPLDLPTL